VTASVSSQSAEGVVTVVIAGEMDMGVGARVDAEIGVAVTAFGVRDVVVDLSQVAFMDSAGIATLIRGRRQAAEANVGYRVVGANGMVRRVLDLTGVWQYLSGEQI